MIGSEFLNYASKFQISTYVGVEDFADKFNFLITVTVFLICATVVTVKQYILKPISCYIATEVGGKNLLDYVENYCWVQGTIPISYAGNVPENQEQWDNLENQKILYYQWVPFVLGLQCILFYLPRVIWQMICYNRTGTDIQHMVDLANQTVHAKAKDREDIFKTLAMSLERLLFQRCSVKKQKQNSSLWKTRSTERVEHNHGVYSDFSEQISQSELREPCLKRIFKYRGTLIAPAYLFVKFLYLANAIGQLFLMKYFLGFGDDASAFGFRVLENILNGRDWQTTLIFPRIAFCYTRVKNLGARDNAVTAQCALPVNMLNEKIYVFLWWWVVFDVCLIIFSILIWISKVMGRLTNLKYVSHSLHLSTGINKTSRRADIELFANRFLRHDGVFIIRMIASNAGEIIASDLLQYLWNKFQERMIDPKHDTMTNLEIPGASTEEKNSDKDVDYIQLKQMKEKNAPMATSFNMKSMGVIDDDIRKTSPHYFPSVTHINEGYPLGKETISRHI